MTTDNERALYETVWSIPAYGEHSPGEVFLPLFEQMIADARLPLNQWLNRPQTVLDAGCGSGKGALALEAAGYRVTGCDLTPDGLLPEAQHLPFYAVCLWDNVVGACGRHTWVYCTDVLEHLPPVYAALVVHRLLQCARTAAFFSIALVPDAFGKWVGRPLHQTVLPYRQWKATLGELGTVVAARDLGTTGLFLVTPR